MNTYAVYQRISKYPLGKRIFTRLISFFAPYFSSISPQIKELRPGYCRVEIKEHRSIHNHIGTIHAIAVCNLCELAMGMVAEASIKPHLRWIPKEMSVQYLLKCKGRLTGTCNIDPEIIVPGDIILPIEVTNEAGELVVKTDITLYISEKPKS